MSIFSKIFGKPKPNDPAQPDQVSPRSEPTPRSPIPESQESKLQRIQAAVKEFRNIAVDVGMSAIAHTQGITVSASKKDVAVNALLATATDIAQQHGLSSVEDVMTVVCEAFGGLFNPG